MFKQAMRPNSLLLVAAFCLLVAHQVFHPVSQGDFEPRRVFNLQLDASFNGTEELVNVHTYLPHGDPWQSILKENTSTTGVATKEQLLPSGRLLTWSTEQGQASVGYQLQLHTQGQYFQLASDLTVPTSYPLELQPYLQETQHVQVNHPEIVGLWKSLGQQGNNLPNILRSIYQYTWQDLESLPFKGTTDALTAVRLKAASCNGKSRLFVALARLNNIPARLVGGLILENANKKTSHQWVEVYVAGHWITFDPTNGYFAQRPSHFLKLYQGDKALFRHTSNIGFDYEFSINEKLVSPAFYPELMTASNNYLGLSNALNYMGLSNNTLSIILLFPLCTLLITFLRNLLGIKTFGIFMPILIASSCMYTGLFTGLVGFISVLFLAWLSHGLLEKMRILKTARLAIVISLVSMFFILLLWHSAIDQKIEFGMLALMPVVIISFVAERIHQVTQDENWKELLSSSFGSLLTICLCYLYLSSFFLQSLFALYPESFLIVLACLIWIGQWEGIRASELIRFRFLDKEQKNNLLGINNRNRSLVYKHNSKELLALAADKLSSKEKLEALSVPVTPTISVIRNSTDLEGFNETVASLDQFVVKPNCGSQGKGILVIKDKQGPFISASGRYYSILEIKQHIKDIISGHYSQMGDSDIAYLEPLIHQNHEINAISDSGLSDIRIILGKGKIISAMLRIPTKRSHGKANLHQGAIGVAIDVHSGLTVSAMNKGKALELHPDTQHLLIGFEVPYWDDICVIAQQCYQAIPLGYLGVDICIDENKGPLVLEVNGRSGLEIQNIHKKGMRQQLLTSVSINE